MSKKDSVLVPRNEKVEGWLSGSQAKMNTDILKLHSTGFSQASRSKITRAQKELFAAFQQEQQRLNMLAEIKYLRKYLLDQRNTINAMASYIKKRDAKEINNYGKVPFKLEIDKSKLFYTGAPTSKFKITHNLDDLRKKVAILDKMLIDFRSIIQDYAMVDWKRKDKLNGGGFDARILRSIRKLRKAS